MFQLQTDIDMRKAATLLISALFSMPCIAESVDYKLSLSLAGISIGAGSCSYRENSVMHEGRDAMQLQLIMSTGRAAGLFYHLRDTVTSVVKPDGTPVSYCKIANEGGVHAVETAAFAQTNDGWSVGIGIDKDGTAPYELNLSYPDKVYDMLSMLKSMRLTDTDNMGEGDVLDIPMVNGNLIVVQHIVCTGKTVIKDGKGDKHNCMEWSVRDNKLEKERETMRVYVTDDGKHIPVRMDIVLGKCFIKALLNGYSE